MNNKSQSRYFLILSLPLVYAILLFLGVRQGSFFTENINNEIDRAVKNYGFPVYRIIQEEYEFLDFITDPPPNFYKFSEWNSLITYFETNLADIGDDSDYIEFFGVVENSSSGARQKILKKSDLFAVEELGGTSGNETLTFTWQNKYIVINRTLGKNDNFLILLVIDYKGVYENKINPQLKLHFSQEELRFSEPGDLSVDTSSFNKEKEDNHSFQDIMNLRKTGKSYPLPAILLHGPGFSGFNSLNLFRPDRSYKSGSSDRDRKTDSDRKLPRGFMFSELTFFIEGKSLIRFTVDKILFSTILNLLLLVSLSVFYTLIIFQIMRINKARQKEKEFVSAITHELRTPLTVIHNAGDNMRQGIIKGDRVAKYGDLIVQQGKRLGDMIESILLFSNLENKTVPGSLREETRLGPWFGEFRIQMDNLAAAEGFDLFWDYAETDLVLLFAKSDTELILSNLISNALKHAYINREPGQIRIKMTMSLPSSLHFEIEDDGAGIPRQDKNRIFRPFERGQLSREAQKKGTGLGLHIARKKAENIQGRLILESPYSRPDGTMDQGCRFLLTVPVSTVTRRISNG